MEIKINDLGSIREAARQFIAQIGEHKVLPSMAAWAQERPPS